MENATHPRISRSTFLRSAAAVPFLGAILAGCATPPKRIREPGKILPDIPESGGTYKLPPLPYASDALEPHIDGRTMTIHHDRHHQGYVNKLNAALEKAPASRGRPLADILADLDSIPADVRTAVRQNGGGHVNHSLFWEIMSPNGGGQPGGSVGTAIDATYGSYENFRQRFSEEASGVFGSGWAWLSVTPSGSLLISSTPNQDSPLMEGLTPILGLDVWEHAYYLNYQNRRGNYIDNFFKVIDWERVDGYYQRAISFA